MAATTVSQSQQGVKAARTTFAWGMDYWLVLVAAALLVFGLLVVYSTTFPYSMDQFGATDTVSIFYRQLIWLGLGLAIVGLILRFGYEMLRRMSLLIMLVTIVLLLVVLVVGAVTFGARRGLLEGSLQPGELAKLATIIYLAYWLSTKGDKLRSLKLGLIPYSVVVGFVAVLIVLQPDMSTAVLIVITALCMFFVAGADVRQLLIGLAVAAVIFGVVALLLLPYAHDRIAEWQAAWNNPQDASFHTLQVLIALGSGGPFGVGFGASRQKFHNLPAPHTDSVFAIIGEELGLVGTLAVLLLYALLIWRGFKVAQKAPDRFGYILAVGVTCSVGFEALMNMMVMTGIMPFTGVPLPFMSYGGSSLIVSMTSVGILLSISRGSYQGPKARGVRAHTDGGWRDWGARLSRSRGR